MKKDNSFIKGCILQALLQLMDEKDFKDISITEITKKAGVSRMAYYRNYYYKEDIFNNYMTDLLEKYHSIRHDIFKAHPNDKYKMMLHVFEYFKENEKFVLALEKSNLSNIIQNRINEYVHEIYKANDTHDKYDTIIFGGALYNTGKYWLLTGKKEKIEDVTKIFVNRMFPEQKQEI